MQNTQQNGKDCLQKAVFSILLCILHGSGKITGQERDTVCFLRIHRLGRLDLNILSHASVAVVPEGTAVHYALNPANRVVNAVDSLMMLHLHTSNADSE